MVSRRLWVYLWLYGDDCECGCDGDFWAFGCDGRWSGMVVMGSLTMHVNLHDVVELYGGKLDEKIASRLTYEQD